MVEESIKAVTTQERCVIPPRSDTMRGKAVLTMFESSEARRMQRIAPVKTVRREAVGAGGASAAGRGALVSGMRQVRHRGG
jgi:hypothetical protein